MRCLTVLVRGGSNKKTVMFFYSKNSDRYTIPNESNHAQLIRTKKEETHIIKQPTGNLVTLNTENPYDLVFNGKTRTPLQTDIFAVHFEFYPVFTDR